MPHNTHPSPAVGAIRPATFADVDDIVAIFIASAPLDQTFTYTSQHTQDYPEDTAKYQKLLSSLWISPEYSDYHVMVAEAPSLDDAHIKKVVACAVWDLSYRNKRQRGPEYKPKSAKAEATAQMGGLSARRDVNPNRLTAVREAGDKASKRLFNDVYGADNHLELVRLNTHPDYMRRGLGSALVNWGVQLAKNEHLAAVSVMASNMGMLLYTHLGFRHLEQCVVQAVGETETMAEDYMALELYD